jgi:LysR family positive regulator for ilvC
MDLENAKLFLHLSRTLHFGKTSRECFVSPSTLTRVIQRIEEEIGTRLFERNRQQVHLTSAGQVFKEYAEGALDEWQRVRTRLSTATLRGQISLYCSVTATYSVLPQILTRFRQLYPEVQIELYTGDAAQAIGKVLNSDVDIAVAPLPERLPPALAARPVAHTPLVFVGPSAEHALGQKLLKRINWAQVPMIFPESGLIKTNLNAWFKRKGIQAQVYSRVSGHEAILSLVSLGFGVGVVPELVLEKSLIKEDIQVLEVRPQLPGFRIAFCARKSQMDTALIRAFWRAIDRAV